MSRKRRVGTLDFETDPFLYGRVPVPFAGVIYFPDDVSTFWGPTCVDDLVANLRELPPCSIYAHNGGKFDFHFLIEYAERDKIRIINGRIAEMKIGNVRLIDSFLLLPFSLDTYKKTKIDYDLFEKERREQHRLEITRYMEDDARNLHELLTGFHERVGRKLTIGGAAFAQIKKLDIEIFEGNEGHDDKFRKYYFGGRVQAFEKGYWRNRPFKYIDINSAYPWAMCQNHPTGNKYERSQNPDLIQGPEFVSLWAVARGCFPIRSDDGSLSFPDDDMPRLYDVTGWEYLAAVETKTVKVLAIDTILIPARTRNFRPYVEKYYAEKAAAKRAGDKIGELAAKYLLNSGYGKFATDPRDFKDYILADYGDNPNDEDYGDNPNGEDEIYGHDSDYGAVSIWSKSAYNGSGFYDVATAASITGSVRAHLWRAIQNCTGVLYCDTDSLFCGGYTESVRVSDKLGDWKIEGEGRELAIAGKKMYAAKIGKEWKTASKGVRLSAQEIIQVAKGKVVTHDKPSPNFSVKHGARFISRKVRRTG